MSEDRPTVVGVRLGNAGKIEYFHCGAMNLTTGQYVVVQSTRGPELARVVVAPDQVLVNEIDDSRLKPILRVANADDMAKADDLKQRAKELLDEARALAAEAGFPAQLDHARLTLDGKRLSISFSHESRVEYRDAVRALSDAFGVRVEMVQVGARDRARIAGGYGRCGRELCCANWLSTFPAISIRMAKDQELPLNPQKISGLCGRLLCCLSYEDEGYRLMRKTLPKVGQRCSTPTGEGKVIALNILQRKVTLSVAGTRVEVGDADLGLIVRWDPSSKAAAPPPSLTPAEAVEQGIMTQQQADEREQRQIEASELQLTAPPQRRPQARAPQPRQPGRPPSPPAEQTQRRGQGRPARRPGGGAIDKPAAAIEGAKTRSFRRNESGGEGAPREQSVDRGPAGPSEGRRRPPVSRPASRPPAPRSPAQAAPDASSEAKPKSGSSRRRRGRWRGRGQKPGDGDQRPGSSEHRDRPPGESS